MKMGTKKCCVPSCTNASWPDDGNETTYHKFPQRLEFRKNWIIAIKSKLDANLQPSSSNLVCSRHFRRSDWQEIKGGKLLLKQGIVPSVFINNVEAFEKTELGKPDITGNPNVSVVAKEPEVVEEEKPEVKEEKKVEKSRKSARRSHVSLTSPRTGKLAKKQEMKKPEEEPETAVEKPKEEPKPVEEAPAEEKPETTKVEKPAKVESKPKDEAKSTKFSIKLPFKSKKDKKRSKDKRRPHRSILALSKRSPKRKEANKNKLKSPSKNAANVFSPKKGVSSSISFVIGTKLDAQDFEGGWHEASIVEVDSDEGEVLIHFIKSERQKTATLSDEWIPMDSCRLRPPQAVMKKSEGFAIGEKCMARWNDSRKFPATVQRLVEDDLYEVLFNDGYIKIVRGTHMTKLKQQPGQPPLIEPIIPIQPILPAPALKDIVIPDIPKDGEWCCYWINDCPVGRESYLDFSHGRINTIIVDDWRLPEKWEKHLFQRIGNYGGKWDAILVSPDGQKFRSKQELKQYLDSISETYDPERYDFCLHKKRAKAIGLLTYTEDYKQALSMDMKSSNISSASLGGTPGTPGLAGMGSGEVFIGSLKVKVQDNLYLCPDCDKTFRKENHLQIHIKHYHEKTAELLGVCPNMQDLAYLRTATDDVEVQEAQAKFMRKSLTVGSPPSAAVPPVAAVSPSSSTPVTSAKTGTPKSSKTSNMTKKATLEATLKPVVKLEMMNIDEHLEKTAKKTENDPDFDPEALIVSHELSRKGLKKRKGAVSLRHCNRKPSKRPKLSESSGMTDSEDTRFSFGLNEPHPKVARLQSEHNTEGSNSFEASPSPSNNYVNEYGEMIKIVRMRKEEVINCICTYPEEDGLMIQCELCLCWQHGICNGIVKESQVPEKYVCLICRNPQRGRPSMRFIHDQDWLYDGKLPTANYHLPYQKTQERFNILKQSHTLTGNLLELKKFLHSLDVKINIAANKDHPKMYLWSKKWESSPPPKQEVLAMQPLCKIDSNDIKFDIKDLNAAVVGDNGQNSSILAGLLSSPGGLPTSEVEVATTTCDDIKDILPQEPKTPSAPEPEAAIDPAKCQYNLLEHIQKQQGLAMARLNTVEAQIIALEAFDDPKEVPESPSNSDSYSRSKQVVHQLIKDLEKMKALAEIHGSVAAY